MTENNSELKAVPCDLCGSIDNSLLLRISNRPETENRDLVKCSHCGLVFISPRKIYDAVEENYFNEHKDVEVFKLYHRIISKWAAPPGKFLDVGCGAGYLLDIARVHGWTTVGVELWEKFVHIAQYYFKLDVRNGTLFDQKFEDKFFNVVSLTEVIEHVPCPSAVFCELNRILSDTGVIFLTMPNISSKSFERLGENWTLKIDPVRHLYYFSLETITEMLNRQGFEILEMFTEGGDDVDEHIRVVAAKTAFADVVRERGSYLQRGGKTGIMASRHTKLRRNWFFGLFIRLGDLLLDQSFKKIK